MTMGRFGFQRSGSTTPYVQAAPRRPGSGVSGGSSAPAQERGFPERPIAGHEAFLMEGARFATEALPSTLERPLAVPNAIAKFFGGGKKDDTVQQKGPVDAVTEAIGSIGRGGPISVEGILDTISTGFRTSQNLFSSVYNASDASALRYIQENHLSPDSPFSYSKPDPFGPLGTFGKMGFQALHTVTGGAVGIAPTKEIKRVQDFYDDLEARGFFESVDSQGNPIRVTPDDLIQKMNENGILGNYQFGDKRISQSAIEDLAYRLATDPTNYVFGMGLVGKAAAKIGLNAERLATIRELAPWAAPRALTVGAATNAELGALRGVGYMDDMVNLGVRDLSAVGSHSAAGAAIVSGNAAQGTKFGLGYALKQVYLPGKGSLGLRYFRGAAIQQSALLGIETASGIAGQAFGEIDEDGNTVKSGFFSVMHDASRSLLDDHPLSGNQLFVVASMFGTPIHEQWASMKPGLRAARERTMGFSDTARMAKEFGEGAGSTRNPFQAGRAQERAMLQKFGGARYDEATGTWDLSTGDLAAGKQQFALWADYMNMAIAFDRASTDPSFVMLAKSLDEIGIEGGPMIDAVRGYMEDLVDAGKITSKDRVAYFKKWANEHVTSYLDKDGNVQKFSNPGGWNLPPDAILNQWLEWSTGHQRLIESTGPLRKAVLARGQTMSPQNMDQLISIIEKATVDGGVKGSIVQSVLARRPAMFVDPAIPPNSAEYFAALMNRGVGSGTGVHGIRPGFLDSEELLGHLRNVREHLPTGREMTHEAADLEAGILDDTQIAGDGGPLSASGIHKMWTRREIEAHRLRSTTDGRAIQKDIQESEDLFKQRWSKRGKYKGDLDEFEGLEPRDMPEANKLAPDPLVRDIADAYNAKHGLPPVRKGEYFKLDPDFSQRTAKAFDEMPMVDPAAKPAYDAFAKESLEQWNALVDAGFKFEPWTKKGQPYADSAAMRADVAKQHLWFFTGGEPHPFLGDNAPGTPYTYNDIFRAVHDVMTHAQEGYQFGPRGELNAAIKHSQMFSPLARRAMLSETHGQNSWVNFHEGPAPVDSEVMSALERARSARLEPDWSSDGLGVTRELTINGTHYPAKFPKESTANGFEVKEYETGEGPGLGVMAYGPDGKAAGFFSGLLKGKDKGAFKIVVDPTLQRQGIGMKLLDEAENAGFDIKASIGKNTFTPQGRALVRSWLEKSGSGRTVAEINKEKPGTVYSDQKAALLPDEIIHEFNDRFVSARPRPEELEAIRIAELSEIQGKKAELLEIKTYLLNLRERMAEIGTVPLHYTYRNRDGHLAVSGDDLAKIREQTQWVHDNLPQHDLAKPPTPYLPWDAADSAAGAIYTQRTNLGRALFDYGPVAKITQFLDYMLEPVSASGRVRDAHAMMYSALMRMGASENEVTQFINELARRRHEAGTLGPMKISIARYENSLLTSQIQQAGESVFGPSVVGAVANPGNRAVMAGLEKQYGGQFYRLVDRSANSLVRKGEQAMMAGEKGLSGKSLLARAFAQGYDAFQHVPVVHGATRFVDKVGYPFYRFYLSLRWQAMNVLENDLLGIIQDGIKAGRWNPLREPEAIQNAYTLAQARRFGKAVIRDQRLTGEAPPAYPGIPDEVIPETGAFTGRFLEPVAHRQFDIRAQEGLSQMLDELPLKSPEAQWMIDHFGPTKETWATEVEDMWFRWDKDGVDPTLQEGVNRVAAEDKWSPEERAQMLPFMLKLGEKQAQVYDDIAKVQLGNTERSRMERALNSYWAYWPLSYQIKTTKWMVDVITRRAGGKNSQLGGAYLLNHLRDIYLDRMQNDPSFRDEMDNNPTLIMAFNMFFPSVPWDQGVSLSRIPRYIGGNVLHLWPEYAGLNNPGDYAQKSLELGAYYDSELLSRTFDEIGSGGDQAPDSGNIQPYR